MEKDHCEGHSGTLALLQEHSKATADLYDKHDDTMLLQRLVIILMNIQ